MKKNVIALALALALTVPLAACNGDRTMGDTAGTGNTSTGRVAQRYHGPDRDYLADGRYTADSDGQVNHSGRSDRSRDMTRDARDMVRDTGDAARDLGNGLRNAAKDIGDGISNAAREY